MYKIKKKDIPKVGVEFELLGLHLSFEERKIRGTNDVTCVVEACEFGSLGFIVSDIIEAKSWKEMKEKFPTIQDVLKSFATSKYFGTKERERIIFIETAVGNDGLYDIDSVIQYDCLSSHRQKIKKK